MEINKASFAQSAFWVSLHPQRFQIRAIFFQNCKSISYKQWSKMEEYAIDEVSNRVDVSGVVSIRTEGPVSRMRQPPAAATRWQQVKHRWTSDNRFFRRLTRRTVQHLATVGRRETRSSAPLLCGCRRSEKMYTERMHTRNSWRALEQFGASFNEQTSWCIRQAAADQSAKGGHDNTRKARCRRHRNGPRYIGTKSSYRKL